MRVRYKPICCRDESNRFRSHHHDFLHRNSTYIILLVSVIFITSLHLTGLTSFLIEEDFSRFSYPLEVENLNELVANIDRLELLQLNSSLDSQIKSINYAAIVKALEHTQDGEWNQGTVVPLAQFKDFYFQIDISPTCIQQWGTGHVRSTLLPHASQKYPISVILIVKSAVNNYARRNAIRGSWYLNQTIDIFAFKTVFVVGGCHERNSVPKMLQAESSRPWSPEDCNEKIARESEKYGDIIQSSGIDSYYNNTIKTFMTLRWLSERCPSDFTLAIDDDYVFEVENFINYLKDAASSYLPAHSDAESQQFDRNLQYSVALHRLSKEYLWAGYLRNYVRPLRFRYSKWYISPSEYVYNKYPPFITGGAVLMSFKTVKHLYYATYFTRSFKFDDVYVGILAHKLGVVATHSDNFMCTLDGYYENGEPIRPNSTRCVGVHEIEPSELLELWITRRRVAQMDARQKF